MRRRLIFLIGLLAASGGFWRRRLSFIVLLKDLMEGRTEITVYQGMKGIPENAFINIKNRSFVVIAEIEVPAVGAEGVIIAQGGEMGGWSLYAKDGAPRFAWNYLGREIYKIAGPARLPAGPVRLRFEFAYDGGLGAGGNGVIFVNGDQATTGRIDHTQPFAFGAETTDVGENLYTCVSDDYKQGANRFTGKIHKVTVQVGKANLSEESQRALEELRMKKVLYV